MVTMGSGARTAATKVGRGLTPRDSPAPDASATPRPGTSDPHWSLHVLALHIRLRLLSLDSFSNLTP